MHLQSPRFLGWEPLYPLTYIRAHIRSRTYTQARRVNRGASTAVSDNVDESARLHPSAYLDLHRVCIPWCYGEGINARRGSCVTVVLVARVYYTRSSQVSPHKRE